MEEMDNDKIPRNLTASFISPLKNLLSKPTNNNEALVKSAIISKMKSDISCSNVSINGNSRLDDSCKALDELQNSNRRSGTSRGTNREGGNLPAENNVEASDHCIHNFQEDNSKSTLKEAAKSFLRTLFSDICRIFHAFISYPAETFIHISHSETLRSRHVSDEANTRIPTIENLDKEFKTSGIDTVEDGSSDNDLKKSTNAIPFSESNSDMSFPGWRISGCDRDANFTTMRVSKKPLRYRDIQNFLNYSFVNDYMDWDSKTFTNPTNYDTKNLASFGTDKNWDGIFPFVSNVDQQNIFKYLDNDSDSSSSTLKFSDSESGIVTPDLNILNSESEFGNCDLKLSIRDQKPAADKQSVIENLNEIRNLINTIAECPYSVQEANISAEKFSGTDFSVGNVQRNPSDTDNLKNEVSTNSDNVLVHLKFLISSSDLKKILKKLSGSNPMVHKHLAFLDTDSNSNNSDSRLSNSNEESNSVKQSDSGSDSEGFELFKEVVELGLGRKIEGFFDNYSNIEDDQATSFYPDGTKNEISTDLMNALARLNSTICPEDSSKTVEIHASRNSSPNNPIFISTKSYESDSKISKRKGESYPEDSSKASRQRLGSLSSPNKPLFINAKTDNFDLKISIGSESSSTAKSSACSLSPSMISDNERGNSTHYIEWEDNDPEDIFKIVIVWHPIKKFEIPPYATVSVESTLDRAGGNLKDPGSEWNPSQLFSIDGNRNILECVTGIDSHSYIVLDISDSFSENSSLICEALMKEYLYVAAKVNLLLIKRIKNISTEEWGLRMRTSGSLYDELEYLSAKLIIRRKDWIKQFFEIEENIEQSRIGSKGTYYMGILRICIILASLLIRFSLEKQLKLEEYETDLMFFR